MPEAKESTGTMAEFQKGKAETILSVINPWIITKNPRMLITTMKNRELLSQGRLWK
jgi:hypothetical protein